jgi:hypothetical protein
MALGEGRTGDVSCLFMLFCRLWMLYATRSYTLSAYRIYQGQTLCIFVCINRCTSPFVPRQASRLDNTPDRILLVSRIPSTRGRRHHAGAVAGCESVDADSLLGVVKMMIYLQEWAESAAEKNPGVVLPFTGGRPEVTHFPH